MKKYKLTSFIIIACTFLLSIHAAAQTDADSKTADKDTTQIVINYPDFEKMTDEEIQQWDDSIANLLWPIPETIILSDGEIQKLKEEEKARAEKEKEKQEEGGGKSVNNPYVPNSVTIDTNKTVGEIPISSAVAPSGAVTYTVPIEVYPGANGMQPELSLTYNHMAGNGIMGMGWNVGGLSSISRGNKNLYYDNEANGVKLNKTDVFYLDGMRLIELSSTSAEVQYESEQGNIRVKAYLSGMGTYTNYFEVFYPNGRTGIYGYPNNSTNNLTYPLTSLKDKYGNTITYQYAYSDNKYKIIEIIYGKGSILFGYITRQDPSLFYEGGLKIRETDLLQKIYCRYNSSNLRIYDFTYQKQKNSSVLTQIG